MYTLKLPGFWQSISFFPGCHFIINYKRSTGSEPSEVIPVGTLSLYISAGIIDGYSKSARAQRTGTAKG